MKSIPIIGPIIGLIKVLFICLILAVILFAIIRPLVLKKANSARIYFTCFSICLLSWTLWINSYWGDTGYYDTMRIPLGNDKSIESAFGEGVAVIKQSVYDQELSSFIVDNHVLFGKLQNDSSSSYVIFDIKKDTLLHFDTYEAYRNNSYYKKPKEEIAFMTPSQNYHNYWGKLVWLY